MSTPALGCRPGATQYTPNPLGNIWNTWGFDLKKAASQPPQIQGNPPASQPGILAHKDSHGADRPQVPAGADRNIATNHY